VGAIPGFGSAGTPLPPEAADHVAAVFSNPVDKLLGPLNPTFIKLVRTTAANFGEGFSEVVG
jgi:hypothetical protein